MPNRSIKHKFLVYYQALYYLLNFYLFTYLQNILREAL
jgi:hypothetical protein